MLGAIIGDILGSTFEKRSMYTRNGPLFPRGSTFTDDSVCTIAVAEARLRGTSYADSLHKWGNMYPNSGFGGSFIQWLASPEKQPYNSFGNGALMRVSPTVVLAETLEEALKEAEAATVVTHNHEVSVKAVRTYVQALWLALKSGDHAQVCAFLESEGVPYHDVDEAHRSGEFHIRADDTLADVFSCLRNANEFEPLMREALYHGGDTDTICAIAGTFGEALWGIPDDIAARAWEFIPEDTMRPVLVDEYDRFGTLHSRL